ncbi:MAG: AAA family ATPase, partial [Erysipelotrichaceae bacterium]|nr:AAA family ATPase [Erysipelotrichaceae bacterium]
MLKKLYIRNFILIDELELDFHDGFSVFTGETGAGKSIFIDCISILIGERMNTSMIRSGTDRTSITGVFGTDDDINSKLGENGYETGKLEVFREITADGRSTTKVNGKNATLAFVKELLDGRIDIHCQRDSQYLLDENRHIQLLDRYCGNEALLSRVKKDFSEYRDLDRKYHNLLENEYNESQLEIIRYQVDEIEKAALKEGEEEQISASIKAFNDREKIQKTIDEIKEIFNGQDRVLDSLYEFTKVSDHLEDFNDIAKNISEINDAYYEIQDNFEAIINYFDSFEGDVTDIDRLNQRL